MSEHDTMPGEDQGHRSLAIALADLADTMPSDPSRVEGVHARVRRLRTRRRAARTAGAVVVGAATIAALVAMRPGPDHVTTGPVSQPAASTLPVPCTIDPDNVTRLDNTPDDSATEAAARAAKVAAAGGATASDGPAASPDAGTDSSYVKAAAQVVSVEAGSLTLAIRDGSLAGQTVSAAISPDTLVTASDRECGDSVLAAGAEVGALLAKGAHGTYSIKVLALQSTAGAKP